jgi:hypothetical protein
MHDTQSSGAGPGHTFQKSPAIDSVMVVIVQNFIFYFRGIAHSLLRASSGAPSARPRRVRGEASLDGAQPLNLRNDGLFPAENSFLGSILGGSCTFKKKGPPARPSEWGNKEKCLVAKTYNWLCGILFPEFQGNFSFGLLWGIK